MAFLVKFRFKVNRAIYLKEVALYGPAKMDIAAYVVEIQALTSGCPWSKFSDRNRKCMTGRSKFKQMVFLTILELLRFFNIYVHDYVF